MRIAYLAFIEIDISNASLIHTREIAEHMAAAGHDVTVVMPRPLKMQKWKNVSHEWVRFWGFDRPRQWAFFLESGCRLLKAHRRRHFDVLYVREMDRNPVLLPLARFLKIPLFAEINGWLLDELFVSSADLETIESVRAHQKRLFQSADGIVVSTTGNAQRVANSYNVSPSRIHPQELGANVAHFRPADRFRARQALGLAPLKEIIVCAGSFHPHHDLGTLLKALPLVLKKFPECVLVLLGTGPQFDSILRRVDLQGLSDRVVMPGPRHYSEMPTWFHAAHVGVLPLTLPKIRQQNGCFALKLWEYMAAGIPVVATDLPDTRSSSILSDKAVLVPPEDPVAMSEALIRILDDCELSERISAAGLEYVSKYRTWEHAARETLEFMTRCMQADQPLGNRK